MGIMGLAPAAAMYQLLRPIRGLTSKNRARPSRGSISPIAVLGQQRACVRPQLREVLGDHGDGVADHGRRVVLQEHAGRTDEGDLAARVDVRGDGTHRRIVAGNELLNQEGVAEARLLEGLPQLGQLGGRVDKPDLALALELENVVGLTVGRLGHHGEREGNLRGNPGLVRRVGEVDDDRAGGVNAGALAGAGKLGLIRQAVHDLQVREGQRVVSRQLVHVACHERGENIVVRHEDELLVGMLPRDRHERVEQLRIRRVGAHMTNIEKV